MKIIDMNELRQRKLPLSESSIRRMMRENKFPKSRQLYGSRKGWLEAEIDQWIEQSFSMEGASTQRGWLADFAGRKEVSS